jgi:hypothetical protein
MISNLRVQNLWYGMEEMTGDKSLVLEFTFTNYKMMVQLRQKK